MRNNFRFPAETEKWSKGVWERQREGSLEVRKIRTLVSGIILNYEY